MIKIIHLAHACFLIENGKEKAIIDPSDNSFGYEIKDEKVNYLLVSHEHWDHNNIQRIIIEDNIGSFKIDKIDSYHDNEKGNLRGSNLIHIIEAEDTRICHLGDLGHILTEEQIKLIGRIDVLLIPVGGVYTIDYKQAVEVVNQLNPSIVIPMHYRTEYWGSDKGISSVDEFLDYMKGYRIVRLNINSLDYTKAQDKTIYII